MHIQVRLMPWFSELPSSRYTAAVLLHEDLPSGSTVRVLISSLASRSPQLGDALYCSEQDTPHRTVVITCNERLVSPGQALDLVLQPGDRVGLAPVYSGG